jgi:hypothetical protein
MKIGAIGSFWARGVGAKTDALLQVRSLSKRYAGQRALCDISFDARGAARRLCWKRWPASTGGGDLLWRGAVLPPQRRRDCPQRVMSNRGGGSHTPMHVRFAPKATVANQNVIRRFVP